MIGCVVPQSEKKIISMIPSIDVAADGISVLTIEVSPNDGELDEQLSQYGEPLQDAVLVSKLEQEGIQVRRLESVEVADAIDSIGEVLTREIIWYGQMVDWRDIHQRKIPSQGMSISKDEVSYYIKRGYLSLLARSWLLGREDGLFVYLQTMPTWHVPRSISLTVGQSSKPVQSEVFDDLSLELLLKDGEAVIFAVVLPVHETEAEAVNQNLRTYRLGEALMGAPSEQETVSMLVIEANILPRE
jgi:hypothetical protein